ncbi:MAG: hypothetical protein CML29_17290 [Rhizobiales bacterium]|nr:hypothetical protein [Hyphomicrobiales bacterium]MBA68664.1 hypothetical protein [Hyphomicrobiales bacterium]|tara:strand:+ start:199 stop:630 length:432 start_codon:yes stop_codon:yes gene_type:complete
MSINYYLTDYSDEIVPCAATPEGWAEWLSKPAPDWRRAVAAEIGQTFDAASLEIFAWGYAFREPDGGITVTGEPHLYQFTAIVDGDGSVVWDFEDIISSLNDAMLGERVDDCDGCWIAFGREQRLIATYHGPDKPVTFAPRAE